MSVLKRVANTVTQTHRRTAQSAGLSDDYANQLSQAYDPLNLESPINPLTGPFLGPGSLKGLTEPPDKLKTPKPPPVATRDDPAVAAAMTEEQRRRRLLAASQQGRQAHILTGPGGLSDAGYNIRRPGAETLGAYSS